MKNLSDIVYNKVEGVLYNDKIRTPNKMNEILSDELYYVLKQYFEIKRDSFRSSIVTYKDGEMDINLTFKATRVLLKGEQITE